jgi:diketogulonate reductase-like aldo/keto reductase
MRARQMPLMAYSPLGQGALLGNRKLVAIANKLGVSSAQLALAWLLRSPDVIVIPESADAAHVRDNHAAAALALDAATLTVIDAAFPAPSGPSPLAVI